LPDRTLLFETVEPLVRSTLEGFKLSGFKFDRDRVFLGQVPPRITGIKVSALFRIRMFLGLLDPDPDPVLRGTDLDPSIIKKKK
jgi:hypothetical protein